MVSMNNAVTLLVYLVNLWTYSCEDKALPLACRVNSRCIKGFWRASVGFFWSRIGTRGRIWCRLLTLSHTSRFKESKWLFPIYPWSWWKIKEGWSPHLSTELQRQRRVWLTLSSRPAVYLWLYNWDTRTKLQNQPNRDTHEPRCPFWTWMKTEIEENGSQFCRSHYNGQDT